MKRSTKILGRILIYFICLMISILVTTPIMVYGEIFNDAYSYEDSFEDTSGLNLSETYGFVVSDGALQAEASTAVAVSECISLPQPEGGTFLGWSFLKISLSDLGASSNTLEVQDCSGSALLTINDLPEGESAIDLSGISEPAIRLMWTVDQVGAKLNFWNIYGTADGATCIEVFPDSDMVNAGDTVTFTITLSTSGAIARNPVLRFSLDDINGLHTPDLDDGLAEDAEVDYGWGNGVVTYRPLEFVYASSGPNGELPADEPEFEATSGEVVWNLDDLSDGFSDNVVVILRVPQGYINGKSLAARATLGHGASSGMYTNMMSVEETSSFVTVNSVANSDQSLYTNYNNLGPGATNIYEASYVRSPLPLPEANPSDMEDITVTITGVGTCSPLFRNVVVTFATDFQIVSTPAVGAPVTGSDPVIVHFDRGDFYYRYLQVVIYYDVPVACTEDSTIGTQSVIVAGNPSWTDTDSRLHDVVIEVCRRGGNWTHRVMSGNDPGNYLLWPGWTEYYINTGSLRAGEYFTTWMPYGNEGLRSHTVPLDHSYDLIEIPDGITFHGIRQINRLSRLYKDCTGTAPAPTDTAFDHNNDPPHLSWKPVDITWDGAPFSNPPDENDPRAVALTGCRLLGVKDNDNPAWQEPDYGLWHPFSLWRMCDGSYGCAELPDGTVMSLVGGTIFTYETVTDPTGAAHECYTYNGWTLYKELKSWPKVYGWPEENQVPAGQVAHIILNPENQNYASQWVDGRWVVNLYGIREYIDLAGVTGEVLTEGLNIPNPDQNVLGESCNVADDITFHFPDPTGCSSALSEDDEACMAWWEVTPACQPPNGWGYPISGNYSNDDFIQMYRFRLNAPILNTTPANTMLDFVTEVRTNDLAEKGADNAIDPARWSSNHYEATTPVTVLELPGLDVEKAGPVARKVGDLFTYTLEITNYGNSPNDGWYLVDWLPRNGVNSSEFTPEYGKVFVNQLSDDVIVEYSMDAGCFTDPLGGTWTAMALQATSRVGYQVETVSDIAPGATCLRLRRKPTAMGHFNPEDTILGAIDVVIPNDVSLEGKWLYNRALAGAAITFGAFSEVPPVETVNVRTKVSSEVVVEIEKTFQVDPTLAGWIKWMLRVHNTSGVKAVNINVVDELPNEIIYEGLADPLPSGWIWVEEPIIGSIGGQLHLMIDELSPDDGNPGTGDDEGTVAFWSRVEEGTSGGMVIENCAAATPENGTGEESCASITVPDLEFNKTQDAIDRIDTTPITDVFPGDEIKYSITVSNSFSYAISIGIYDELDMYVDYIPGTFTVNSAAASDIFISGGVLNYEYPDPVNPGETLTLTFDVRVKDEAPDSQTIENSAQITACVDPLDPSSCFSTVETLTVYNRVFCDETDNDGDGFSICDRDCDDANPDTFPGAPEQCDGKDNDCDELIPGNENDSDGDGYMICDGDCDDSNPDINPETAKDTFITYNGDFIVKADDYTGDSPTGDAKVSALVKDSESVPVVGWNLLFEIYDTEGNLIFYDSLSTDETGSAMTTVYDLQVGVYKIINKFIGDDCFYHSSQIFTMLAIYDSGSGFATGGGWYMASDEVTGISARANFGFNVKYKQDVSTGNLEFQFHTGNLNLKSTSIDWIVISGSNAQFKGQGRFNGIDGYFFRVTAKDFGEPGAGTDEFDIKIWDGDPDNSVSSLVHSSKNILSGGNIVIHKK
jgi:hypothetical protein